MARKKSSMVMNASLEVETGGPLDSREVVDSLTDLTDAASFPYFYEGMTVYCKENKKKYVLKGEDPTLEESWTEIGGAADAYTKTETNRLLDDKQDKVPWETPYFLAFAEAYDTDEARNVQVKIAEDGTDKHGVLKLSTFSEDGATKGCVGMSVQDRSGEPTGTRQLLTTRYVLNELRDDKPNPVASGAIKYYVDTELAKKQDSGMVNLTEEQINEIFANVYGEGADINEQFEEGVSIPFGTWKENGVVYDLCRKVLIYNGTLPTEGIIEFSLGETDVSFITRLSGTALASDGSYVISAPAQDNSLGYVPASGNIRFSTLTNYSLYKKLRVVVEYARARG